MSLTPGALGLSSKRMTATAPSSVMSKTFENYVRVRERAEILAKEKVEHLNELALKKLKNEKKAERAMKNNDNDKK